MNIPELLRTKLLIPPVRKELVERPRLFGLLDQSLSRGLAVVSAPVGYGKTTLLSDWARRIDLPVAWLSLDEGDNDPARFLGHFCASFQGAAPALAESLLELAHADRFGLLGAAGSTDALQTALLNRLEAAADPIVLVMDDFHLISAQPIHRLVAFLVDHLPPQLHLIIASRADPPLPLARLRARGDMIEIRQRDLRFTQDEAIAFLNQVMGLELEAGDVTALESRTEGWIAGLQLAATSLRTHADTHRFIQDFKGSNRYILDYLVEEVLQRQTPELQPFLLQTSLLNRLSGPLCDAVTEQSGGQAVLEMLERANLFIVPLDDERRWYRYHRLFADLLQKKLGETAPQAVADLHRRASMWHEKNGLKSEAIDHSLAAKDSERAAQLIEGVAEATLLRSESTTLRKWLDALPEEQMEARPTLCAYHAWVLLLDGASINTIEARLKGVAGHQPPFALPLQSWLAQYRGDVDTAVEQSRQALEQLPEKEVFLRGLAALSLSGAYHIYGDFAASQRVLQEAVLNDPQGGNVMIAVYAVWYRAERCRREGNLQEADSLFQQALDLATDENGERLPIASQVLMGMSEIALEWNELDTAERYALQSISLAGGWAQAGALESYVVLARIRQAQGDWSGAHEALKSMRQVASEFKSTDVIDRASDTSEAWMRITQYSRDGGPGQLLEEARRWAERYGLAGQVDPMALEKDPNTTIRRLHKYEYPVAARLRIAEGRAADALTLMEASLPIIEKLNRTGLIIENRILAALAARNLGQNDRAFQSLGRALALAEPAGYLRIFLDEGKPLSRLLHEAASRGIHPDYVGRLLAAFAPSTQHSPAPSTHHPLAHPLSARELDVLRLIAEGLSNEEIARQLVVSLPTVKFHASNILGKLSVKNRTEAVARARSLGILSLS